VPAACRSVLAVQVGEHGAELVAERGPQRCRLRSATVLCCGNRARRPLPPARSSHRRPPRPVCRLRSGRGGAGRRPGPAAGSALRTGPRRAPPAAAETSQWPAAPCRSGAARRCRGRPGAPPRRGRWRGRRDGARRPARCTRTVHGRRACPAWRRRSGRSWTAAAARRAARSRLRPAVSVR
jgi:hypothetical protein